ncbi:MAG TPA: trigger factor [Gammaproteobacteria bacterium]|nr:trigger factor [Gammaproteobacteria bacterium]
MQDMQVSIEATGTLERCLTVKIPEARIAGEVASRLTTLSRNAKIQGFRPGKAPMKLVQRLYGDRVRQEIIGEVIRSSFTEAIKENGLQLASQASIEPLDSGSDQGFTYQATFEVYPQITLVPAQQLTIIKPVCKVTEQDIDKMIEDLHGTIEGELFASGDLTGLKIEPGTATRQAVRKYLEDKCAEGVKQRLKAHVMDALLEANPIDVPKGLVNSEAHRLHEEARRRAIVQKVPPEQIEALQSPALFEQQAQRRVALGLIIATIIHSTGLKADAAKVRSVIGALAANYEDPAKMIKWYYEDHERLQEVEAIVLEEEAVEWVLAQVQVEPRPTTLDALMGGTPPGHGKSEGNPLLNER